MGLILCIFGFLWILLFLRARIHRKMLLSVFYKSLASSCFLLFGLYGLYLTKANYGFLVVAGLFFGVLGDIWLGLKWAYTRQEQFFLLMGFIFFSAGHVFYLIAMTQTFGYGVKSGRILALLVGAIITSYLIVTNGKRVRLHYGTFKNISILYGFLLISMCVVSIYLGSQHHWIRLALTRTSWGGALFLISDLLLSVMYFGKQKSTPIMITLNHITYYAAQFLIAWSIFSM